MNGRGLDLRLLSCWNGCVRIIVASVFAFCGINQCQINRIHGWGRDYWWWVCFDHWIPCGGDWIVVLVYQIWHVYIHFHIWFNLINMHVSLVYISVMAWWTVKFSESSVFCLVPLSQHGSLVADASNFKGGSNCSSVWINGFVGCSAFVVKLDRLAVSHINVAPHSVLASCLPLIELVVHNGLLWVSWRRRDGLTSFVTDALSSSSSLLNKCSVRSTLLKVHMACVCVVVAEEAVCFMSPFGVCRVLDLRFLEWWWCTRLCTLLGWHNGLVNIVVVAQISVVLTVYIIAIIGIIIIVGIQIQSRIHATREARRYIVWMIGVGRLGRYGYSRLSEHRMTKIVNMCLK